MPPKTQRSRACAQCLDRRVKCDETPGFCQRCTRLGLNCSGPVTLAIIDMTDKVRKPRQRKKQENSKAVASKKADDISKQLKLEEDHKHQQARSLSEPDLDDNRLPTELVLRRNSTGANPLQQESSSSLSMIRTTSLPTVFQPSLHSIYDKAFVSHFVSKNSGIKTTSTETPWVSFLPALHEAQTPALKLSIRAASMAFYARMHAQIPILVDSYRWYDISLRSSRSAVAKLDGKAIPTPEECLVPIILSLYEVYAGTINSGSSVFHHFAAATQMLDLRGPGNCSSSFPFLIFVAVRVSDAHKSVVFNQPSVFSSQEWLTLPFSKAPKNAHMRLIDTILAIPACARLSGLSCHLKDFFASPIPPGTDLTPMRERILQLLGNLQRWEKENPHLCTTLPVAQVTNEDMTTLIPGRSLPYRTSAIMLPDNFIAMTSATFKAGYLILTLLLHKISQNKQSSTPMPSPVVKVEAETYAVQDADSTVDLIPRGIRLATEILNLSAYLEKTHPIGFNFLRAVFPLVIVAIVGPLTKQQKTAKQTLDRWGDSRGLGGLCGAWGI